MKKVNKSKNPSVQQMLNMASNLRDKFNKASTVEIKAWCFSSGTNEAAYRLYVADNISEDFDFWFELQAYYFFKMEEAS